MSNESHNNGDAMKTARNKSYWLLSGAFFSFFLTWSFAFSLFPLWLNQTIGLSGQSTGLIFSINALSALLVMPCFGYIQDKLGHKKHLLVAIGIMLVLSGPFMMAIYGPLLQTQLLLAAVLGGLFFGFAFGAGVGALESYIARAALACNFEFGRARLWGSLGWAAATFMAGALFNINPNINFILASCCALFLLTCLAFVDVDAQVQTTETARKKEAVHFRDALRLLQNPRFWAFSVFVMGVSCIYSVYDQQFPIYFASLFSTNARGTEMFGYLNSFQVFLEAGGMFIAPAIVNRIGPKNGLVLSGVIMAVRMIGSGYADGPIEISVMKLLHAAELPIMLVALFKYIANTFDERLSATVYLVGFQFMTQVMASGLSIVAGNLYDSIGFSTSYKILGSIVLFFVIVSHFLLTSEKKSNSSNNPDLKTI